MTFAQRLERLLFHTELTYVLVLFCIALLWEMQKELRSRFKRKHSKP